ncbi:hypothetical protein JZ751_003430, partial [Albula glossodonta]
DLDLQRKQATFIRRVHTPYDFCKTNIRTRVIYPAFGLPAGDSRRRLGAQHLQLTLQSDRRMSALAEALPEKRNEK